MAAKKTSRTRTRKGKTSAKRTAPRLLRAPATAVAAVPHVVSYEQVLAAAPGDVPSQSEYALCILAEGDSWFSMSGIPGDNLLNELRFERRAIVVNAAYPGDTIRHMSELSTSMPLRRMLFEKNFAFDWDVFLLSGGGNDLIDSAGNIIISPPNGPSEDPLDYINRQRLAILVQDVQAGYRRIASLRDTSQNLHNRDIPIVTHQYDFPTPRDSPARFLGIPIRGPWLAPALDAANVSDPRLRQAISDHLLVALGTGIAELANGPDPIPNFHVTNTANTLDRADAKATGVSGDWQNEIHPSSPGYRKLGDKVVAVIEGLNVGRP